MRTSVAPTRWPSGAMAAAWKVQPDPDGAPLVLAHPLDRPLAVLELEVALGTRR